MKLKLKEQILRVLSLNNGISELRLSLSVTGILGPMSHTRGEYDAGLEELLKDKEIQKLEFSDPDSPNRAKNIYFLKGTTFRNFTLYD